MKHGRCLLRENTVILSTERGIANAEGNADTPHTRRIIGECLLSFLEWFSDNTRSKNTARVDDEQKILP